MQKPVSETSGIIKREDFRIWDRDKPPQCRSVVVSIDTALSQKENANYSAITVWGVFTNIFRTSEGQDVQQNSVILLSAERGRWDFSALCNKCQEVNNKYSPDFMLVEDTSAGLLLIPELYKRSVPVLPIKPERDKTFRLQATTPFFQAGRVWVPADKMWAEEVVSEVISFNPRAKNQTDDYTDTVSQVIVWLRDFHKIDNDAYSSRWDDEITSKRQSTYWSSLTRRTV
jgi:predicted phage terminase large subunit-like protein